VRAAKPSLRQPFALYRSRRFAYNACMDSIYLDHNATTPTRPEVIEAVAKCQAEIVGNPASQHRLGQKARQRLEDAREQVAAILDADLAPPRRDRLVFTSGGTEANNLAILGVAASEVADRSGHASDEDADAPPQLIVSAAEHQSVIEPAERLLEQGWRLDTLGLDPQGVVFANQLPPLLGPQTRLVSVQLANHETGVLQPVAELAALCNEARVPMHTDAVQVVGKRPVSFRLLGVAALSIAAHKFQGPPGIGALLLREDVPVRPLVFGGHQQGGLRPGTEPVALVVGMAVALDLWQRGHEQYARRLRALRDRFEGSLRAEIPNIVVHGAPPVSTARSASAAPLSSDTRLPQTSNIAFPGLDGQVLLMAIDLAGVACSVGAACSSGSTELSPTLRAMDVPENIVASSLRFSLGATTTEADVDEAVARIVRVCREIRTTA
jgi:cysteine desulfurase